MPTKHGSVTAGDLKKKLENIPDNAIIAYQRIEDVYFKEYGWSNAETTHNLLFDTDPQDDYDEYVEVYSLIYHDKKNILAFNAHFSEKENDNTRKT